MKKIMLLCVLLLSLGMSAHAQDHHHHQACDLADLNQQVDAALGSYFVARGSATDDRDALDALTALQAELSTLATACTMNTALDAVIETEDAPELLEQDVAAYALYDSIPQTRTEDGGFLLGEPDAPFALVMFADFACPHCQSYAAIIQQFIEDFVVTGQARLEYRMFVSGADPTFGPYVAQLAECAEAQQANGFWVAHDVLYELGSRGRFNNDTAQTIANRLGLDYDALQDCAQTAEQYRSDILLGTMLGVQFTPTLMIRVGKGNPQFISVGGQQLNRGGVPYEILEAVVASFGSDS